MDTSEKLLSIYRNTCDEIIKILPLYFNEFSKSPLEINSKTSDPSYYLTGTANGARPGRF